MKIALVVEQYAHGTLGGFVQALARGLSRRGHQVIGVDLGDREAENWDEGVRVITLRRSNLRYIGNLISRLRLRKWLLSRLEQGEIDVTELTDARGYLPFGVKRHTVVIRLHMTHTGLCLMSGQRAGRGLAFYERRTLASNHNWIAVSRHILDLTQKTFGVSPTRSVVIYNPFLPFPWPLPEVPGLPAQYVLYVGEVCRRKGSLVLAEAAGEFMKNRPDLHLVYVGGIATENGRLISDDIKRVAGPEIIDRIHFLGRVDRATALACMSRAEVFVFPSRIEAFGLVVVEAMACGIPVVCMDCAPGPEIVEHGVTGLLADPTSPKDFAEKIKSVLENRELGDRLVTNARRVASECFNFERCLEATERFYETCIGDFRVSS